MPSSNGREEVQRVNRRVVIYTPVYEKSPGTRYRVDMLCKSLSTTGSEVVVLHDPSEGLYARLYNQRLSAYSLTKKSVWGLVGSRIARRILALKPDLAILVTDVASSAAKELRRAGVEVIVSIEDLTVSYNQSISDRAALIRGLMGNVLDSLTFAKNAIAPSYVLAERMKVDYGVNCVTVPIGLEVQQSEEESLLRKNEKAVHARQISDLRQVVALNDLVFELAKRNIGLLALRFGKHLKEVKGVNWFWFEDPYRALKYVSGSSFGVVTQFRPSYTLSSLYFHTSLYQPIYALGEGPWRSEASRLGIRLCESIDVALDPSSVHKQAVAASELSIPKIHSRLFELI